MAPAMHFKFEASAGSPRRALGDNRSVGQAF